MSRPSAAHWIACKDLQPALRGEYLVYHPHWPEPYRVVRYSGKGWENGRDKQRAVGQRITHWMELPEPPLLVSLP